MTFFVAVLQEVKPELLDRVLATMRGDFATSRRRHPGRRSSRIFQRLNQPNVLIALAEWDTQADYEALRRTPAYQQITLNADPPARIEHLTRLRSFIRMVTSPAVVGCAALTTPAEHAADLEAYMLGDVRHGVEAAPGLVGHEIFRVGNQPGHLLVVHGWRSIEDLERFRRTDGLTFEGRLSALRVVTERFTGVVAAQYSRHDPPPGGSG
ncbi:MAG: antibiotic biosynthesis monooxygenase [Chloroflexota bacterium]